MAKNLQYFKEVFAGREINKLICDSIPASYFLSFKPSPQKDTRNYLLGSLLSVPKNPKKIENRILRP